MIRPRKSPKPSPSRAARPEYVAAYQDKLNAAARTIQDLALELAAAAPAKK